MNCKIKNIYKYFFLLLLLIGSLFVVQVSVFAQETSSPAFSPSQGNQPGSISTQTHSAPGDQVFKEPSFFTLNPVKWILYMVLVLMGWFLTIGAIILKWVLNPVIWGSGGFLEQGVVYRAWGNFRDLFNMLFILMLLFSAFSTIFQVDKYNIKKIWLKILLAALLINFSYPITRIIIDISNVMMFSFLNATSGLEIAANFAQFSNIQKTLLPLGYSEYPIPYLLASIIFVFVLAVTIIVLAVLLVIRLLALLLLIVTSPVGFAGSAFPGIGSYVGKWWDNLIKYSFFGPIMAFTLILATGFMGEIGRETTQQMIAAARVNTMDENLAEWLGNSAMFFLPIMILWMGMGVATSMSIAGAGAVVGQGKKFSRWAGNLPMRGAKGAFRVTGIPGGAEARLKEFKKTGFESGKWNRLYGGSEAQALKDAKWAGRFKNGKTGADEAQDEFNRKKAAEMRKEWKDKGGAQDNDLADMLKSGSAPEKIAAAMEMAENNGFGSVERYESARSQLQGQPVYQKMFDDKVKEKHIKMVIDSDSKKSGLPSVGHLTPDQQLKQQAIYDKHLDGMSMEKIAKQKGIHDDDGLHNYVKKFAQSSKKCAAEVARAAGNGNLSNADRKSWQRGLGGYV